MRLTPRRDLAATAGTDKAGRLDPQVDSAGAGREAKGKHWRTRQFGTRHEYGVEKGKPIWVERIVTCGLEHATTDGIVGQTEAKELRSNQFRGLAPQNDLRHSQMGLEVVVDPFVASALRIKGNQGVRGSDGWSQKGGRQPEHHVAGIAVHGATAQARPLVMRNGLLARLALPPLARPGLPRRKSAPPLHPPSRTPPTTCSSTVRCPVGGG